MGMRTKGLDLSEWNEGIDFQAIKNAGYTFVILRAGFTGYGTGTSYKKDSCFERFYQKAKAVGLNVGAYWYSCANTKAKGKAEADFMYENCLKGKQFEYPVYIDVEDNHWQVQSKRGTTDAIIEFCSTLENHKYFAGVYASYNWFKNYIIESEVARFTHWLAYWTGRKPAVGFNYALWQNSSEGQVAGFRVDTNVCYEDFPAIIKENGFNGFSKEVKPVEPEKPEEPVQPEGLKVGDKVVIVGTGNGSSYGNSNTAYGLGYIRYILKVWDGRPYPYQVGNSAGTTGFYTKEALRKL